MIELYEKVESTNDLALEAADRGAEAGRCWVADHQTKGRGQRNRDGERNRWFSPPDANIYASLLLRPDLEPSRASAMSLAAGVALAGAIESRGEVELWIKWPNDLYIGERKLAGILTEASTADGELSAVVVGFGLNVNATEEQFEGELAGRATSLRAETGRRWDRMGLSLEIRRRLLSRCRAYAEQGLAAVRDELEARDRSAGRTVRLDRGDRQRSGTARGIAEDGRLVVEIDGTEERVRAGSVEFVDL